MKSSNSNFFSLILSENFKLRYKISEYIKKHVIFKKYIKLLLKNISFNFYFYQKKYYLKFIILIKKIGKIYLDPRLYPFTGKEFDDYAREIYLKCNIDSKKICLEKSINYHKKLRFFLKTIEILDLSVKLTKKNLEFLKKIIFEVILFEILKISPMCEIRRETSEIFWAKNSFTIKLKIFFLELNKFFFSKFKKKKSDIPKNSITKDSFPGKVNKNIKNEEKNYSLLKSKKSIPENLKEIFFLRFSKKNKIIFLKSKKIWKKQKRISKRILSFLFSFGKSKKAFDSVIENLFLLKNKMEKEKKNLRNFYYLMDKKILKKTFFFEKRNEKMFLTIKSKKIKHNLTWDQTKKKLSKYHFQIKLKKIFPRNSLISFSRLKDSDLENKMLVDILKKKRKLEIIKKFSGKSFIKFLYLIKNNLLLKKISKIILKKNVFLRRKIEIKQKTVLYLREKLQEIKSMEVDISFINKDK